MASHGHGHDGGGGNGHGHSCAHEHLPDNLDDPDGGEEWSLYQKIDQDQIRGLNVVPDTAFHPFKPRDQRLSRLNCAESNTDEQMILQVPFSEFVRVKSICVIGANDQTAPSELKVFVNRDDIDFTNADDIAPTQEWELPPEYVDGLEFPVKQSKFNNVTSLTMYFPSNFGDEKTCVYYIGLKGEFTSFKRQAVEAVYEARALPTDHKVPGQETMGFQPGF